MTSSKRLTELAEVDVGVERIVGDLEDALEAIPTLIFLLKLVQVLARRELREAGEEALALLGDRHGVVTSEPEAPPVPGVEAEAEG